MGRELNPATVKSRSCIHGVLEASIDHYGRCRGELESKARRSE
jgi:hypothetical protein